MGHSLVSLVTLALAATTSTTATTTLEIAAPIYDARIEATDVTASVTPVVVGEPVRLYATITNAGTGDIEGLIRFLDDDQFIGGKVFSLRANNRAEDAWVIWIPRASGTRVIRVEIINDQEFRDATPANNSTFISIPVDGDLDRDGIGDSQDDDRDGDGLSNAQEAVTKTNPDQPDTDQDKTPDNKDAYPLDPEKQVAPKPTKKPEQKPISAEQKPSIKTPRPVSVPPAQNTIRETDTALLAVEKPLVLTSEAATSTTIVAEPEEAPAIIEPSMDEEPMPPPSFINNLLPTPLSKKLAVVAAVTALASVILFGASSFLRKRF